MRITRSFTIFQRASAKGGRVLRTEENLRMFKISDSGKGSRPEE